MRLIDSHAHLTSKGLFERLDEVLANCREAGVEHVITIAGNRKDAEAALEIAREQEMVSATAGIHPHDACKVVDGDLERVAELLSEPEVVAVGEIGLDYFYDFSDRESQKRVFSEQLKIAQACDLPLVIHCREAFDDAIVLLENHGFRDKRVVVHCFSGTAEEAKRVADRGWRISFTGMVTFNKMVELQELAREYPADLMMLETDSPYLSPVPIRHVRPNQPSHIVHAARFLAQLRNVPLDELAQQTVRNTQEFFGLDYMHSISW